MSDLCNHPVLADMFLTEDERMREAGRRLAREQEEAILRAILNTREDGTVG